MRQKLLENHATKMSKIKRVNNGSCTYSSARLLNGLLIFIDTSESVKFIGDGLLKVKVLLVQLSCT
jgi:hypothetical protein